MKEKTEWPVDRQTPVLLMTGTIKPFVKVQHNDPKARLQEYTYAIQKYIAESCFQTIIFAENSGYPFDFGALQTMASEHNKRFIFLSLVNTQEGNMSTGEAVLMKRALDACPFLTDNDVVWKVTGRLWIENVNRIVVKQPKGGNIFLYAPRYDAVQTWFFCARVGDLKNHFLSEETIHAMKKHCIEYAWMDCIRHCTDIQTTPFRIYPNAIGVRSGGQTYTQPTYRLILNQLLLRQGYFTVSRHRRRKNREGL